MAAISFEKNMSINPDWGVKNLIEAIDAGSVIDRIPEEEFKRVREKFSGEITEESVARFRARINGKKN